MSEETELFKQVAAQSQLKRAQNIKTSTAILKSKQLTYIPKNDGAHIVIFHADLVIDFWPSTGKWKVRKSPKEDRGVFKLLKYIGVS